MAEFKIIGIRKDGGNHENPYEAISHYQWFQPSSGKTSISDRLTVVSWVEGGMQAYVESIPPRAYCSVNTSRYGTKFLQTRADATDQNNLLRLPEC